MPSDAAAKSDPSPAIAPQLPLWLAGLCFGLGLVLNAARAVAQAIPPPLAPPQSQRLLNDLLPSRSRAFFLQGQEQLELEIFTLQQPEEAAQPLLRIKAPGIETSEDARRKPWPSQPEFLPDGFE